MIRRVVTTAGILICAATTALADFSYQEKSTITGGVMASMMHLVGVFSKQAREPMQSSISVKGDKMAHRSAQHLSVIDVGAQTITQIDLQKKSYSVVTFEQMKQMMEQAAQKMKQPDPNSPQMTFKVSADVTGKSKQIGPYDAKETVIKIEMQGTDQKSGQTGSMVTTMDTWIAPAISGYQEVRDFYRRMAEKLNWSPGGNPFMAARPDVAQGVSEAYKELAKMDGMPVMTVMTMGAAGSGPAGQSSQDNGAPAAQPQDQQQQSQQRPSVGGALGGALGGRFGLGRKKQQQQQDQNAPPQQGSGNASASGTLIEMTMEMSGYSSNPVPDSEFAVPAGFKQVQPDTRRMQ